MEYKTIAKPCEAKFIEKKSEFIGYLCPVQTEEQAVAFVKGHHKSTLGNCEMEGVVCRPAMELRDRRGERVIVKIKWQDFRKLAEG